MWSNTYGIFSSTLYGAFMGAHILTGSKLKTCKAAILNHNVYAGESISYKSKNNSYTDKERP